MTSNRPKATEQGVEIVEFPDVGALWTWLESREPAPDGHGVWVRLFRAGAARGIRFEDLLEAGLAYGWSESTRHAYDTESYLQRFSPRRGRGTASERNRRIAERLEAEGRMTPAGRAALGILPSLRP